MTSVFQLYGRPLAADTVLPALSVVGVLPSYEHSVAYSERLSILNAVGDCKVELVEGHLPPGWSLRVDQATKEVVVEWPAYTPPTVYKSGIDNADFSLGNDGSWELGPGWSIEAGSAVFRDFRGHSPIVGKKVPAEPGRTITLSVDFQQGGSSEGNLTGAAYLLFFDASGKQLHAVEGTVIRSGSSGSWAVTTASGAGPTGTALVAPALSANRRKQNRLARADNFRWDHTWQEGTAGEEDYSLLLKVTDSLNRVAYWSGIVSENFIYLTSLPYTSLAGPDAMTVEPFFVSASTKLGLITFDQPWEDSLTFAPFFVSASTKSLNWTHPQPAEDFLTVAPFFVSASTKVVMVSHVQPQEDNLTFAPFFTSASTKVVLVNNTIPFEALTVSPFFVSASTS